MVDRDATGDVSSKQHSGVIAGHVGAITNYAHRSVWSAICFPVTRRNEFKLKLLWKMMETQASDESGQGASGQRQCDRKRRRH
jgi:hypothetical protein